MSSGNVGNVGNMMNLLDGSLELLRRAGLLAAGALGVRDGLVGGRQFGVGLGQVLLVL